MYHWSSGLPVCSHHKGPGFKSTGGYLCEIKILLLVLSRYNNTYVKYVAARRRLISSKTNNKRKLCCLLVSSSFSTSRKKLSLYIADHWYYSTLINNHKKYTQYGMYLDHFIPVDYSDAIAILHTEQRDRKTIWPGIRLACMPSLVGNREIF
jgi:hypothetical protein